MHARNVLLSMLAAAALLLAVAPTAASAQDTDVGCPCWQKLPAVGAFLVCHDSPGSVLNTFGYLPPGSGPTPGFYQVTSNWCRVNGQFQWITPAEAWSCHRHLLQACFGTPAC